jgi:hypothetical protein
LLDAFAALTDEGLSECPPTEARAREPVGNAERRQLSVEHLREFIDAYQPQPRMKNDGSRAISPNTWATAYWPISVTLLRTRRQERAASAQRHPADTLQAA